jgi:3-deoxy-D-manno-octulosonic-acid transferase
LITALRQQLPGMRLLLTNGTATGRSEGAKLLQSGDVQVWQPWDTSAAVTRFLDHFKPSMGILMETEIWPNLVAECRQRALPLVLANARMSDKSMRQAKRLGWLSRPAFAQLSAVWAQTPADAQRLTQLGAKVQGVFGNIKFDATPNASQIAQGKSWRSASTKPVVMLASSREGEELALLQILRSYWPLELDRHAQVAIDSIVNDVTWLIVPRHPQRFDEVAALIQAHDFSVSRRSGWASEPPADGTSMTLWLGDSLGEMALYFALADVALLGGSFEPLGGQNLIEAAACACPVVMGPHTFNFAEAADQAQQTGAAQRVIDLTDGVQIAATLALNAVAQLSMAQRATQFAQANRGAVAKTAQAVFDLLGQQRVDSIQIV